MVPSIAWLVAWTGPGPSSNGSPAAVAQAGGCRPAARARWKSRGDFREAIHARDWNMAVKASSSDPVMMLPAMSNISVQLDSSWPGFPHRAVERGVRNSKPGEGLPGVGPHGLGQFGARLFDGNAGDRRPSDTALVERVAGRGGAEQLTVAGAETLHAPWSSRVSEAGRGELLNPADCVAWRVEAADALDLVAEEIA